MADVDREGSTLRARKSTNEKHAVASTRSTHSKLNVSRSAVFNLVFFSILVFAVPLVVFFYGMNHWFQDNPTLAGIAAALSANAVVILFVVVAFSESDESDKNDSINNKSDKSK
ncbi:hypothetical protein BATDEDRAFT_85796 [Batrachochytrium dendrobatidis JAM81]|uniref:Uncharacterized protein n=2 Tax=Batrachochytrium dendrobatidis TaxID=109871 RepID=F4NUD6_BATDJ|nr:uncharacterized protein BATDEDRAFT_85796 [Batrachochytrium dendrobatidis JAM81]EGF83182.1 hypothetical protein BATDEDRAFT_85796 [Batrachochytrium dendrobatidis JAM81]KAJ8325731.1 vacuolar ATPase assembly integral membrane protein vma21 [Batrachochytrium dendrobatidis]KAK5671620.1 vacuolar ATPase assembly integral membrane protein vma21 [Batrachochytrium dendrobatidis]OAJ36388.1 hypothetical protein BDEG_20568 [Batrachochytrium dendrobatidis JEL423]|eukprot:XP_006676010.1 hypothetical protein BATDEDRAFT_85796 [Batrachochytrium dendrobatidis JAM81]